MKINSLDDKRRTVVARKYDVHVASLCPRLCAFTHFLFSRSSISYIFRFDLSCMISLVIDKWSARGIYSCEKSFPSRDRHSREKQGQRIHRWKVNKFSSKGILWQNQYFLSSDRHRYTYFLQGHTRVRKREAEIILIRVITRRETSWELVVEIDHQMSE